MFQHIRYRLLLSYLAVLTVILSLFTINVRIIFANSLKQELMDRVTALAKTASGELDMEDEGLRVDGETLLLNSHQTLQWFDLDSRLVEQRGETPLAAPLNPAQMVQAQTSPYQAWGITLPVREEERNDALIGYVRASESFEAIDRTLRRLDLGLGSGIVIALILSGLGGIWLTQQAMQPIEKSFRQLQQFTADASHELRNPLMAIKSNAAVALKYSEGIRDLDAEKFRAIASATSQMTLLTEDLLLLARTDQAPPQRQDLVNLTALLQDLVQLYRAEAEIKHIHFKQQILENLEILGDAVQLNRLFTNLISNALRYTPEQGSIAIQTHHEATQILVSIEDTGIGIAADQLEQIFDRFWRADRSRSQGSGFGLGLAIAHNIAQHHGGSITVTSQPDVGSCFVVQLPIHHDQVFQANV